MHKDFDEAIGPFECPHCGYVVKSIDFRSCPGCGCDARREYRRSAADASRAGRSAGEKPGYPGLFSPELVQAALSGPSQGISAVILRLLQASPLPVAGLLDRWYRKLPGRERADIERTLTGFVAALGIPSAGLGLFPTPEGDIILGKIIELAAGRCGVPRSRPSCSLCTYCLGSDRCGIADILRANGISPGTVPGKGKARYCILFTGRVDRENLARRIGLSLTKP